MNEGPADFRQSLAYVGKLPVFGSAGEHPQFRWLQDLADKRGIEYRAPIRVSSTSRWLQTPIDCFRLLALVPAAVKLLRGGIRHGGKLLNGLRFIRTRGIRSQIEIPRDGALVILPSFPMTLGQSPWLIEIEDVVTLFWPCLRNGQTKDTMIQQHPYYPFVKHLLLSESCRGIVTHMESTAQSLPLLFEAPLLGAKVFHVPWGIFSGSTSARTLCSDTVTILFTNSWHQDPRNFYLRGGLDVLEAFDRLVRRFSFLQLILRTRLPDDLPHRYRKMIDRLHQVKVLPEKLTRESMDNLFAEADVFVLPSARIHVVSILEAMAHGLALVVSDGWGISEYVEDGRTGLIVPGRYGKVSWRDDHGMLREDYTDMMSPDEHFVSKLTQSMKRLVGDAALRQSLGQNAQAVATNQFSLPVWRNNFAAVLETVMNPKNNTAK